MAYPDTPVFKLSQLTQVSEGDHEFEEDVVNTYAEDFPKLVARLHELCVDSKIRTLSQTESDELTRSAHDIKSSSSNVGAAKVHGVGEIMETLAKTGQYERIFDYFADCDAKYNEFWNEWLQYKTSW
eukprot:TRINITY_DN776_c0_g1_i1.p1 TRINITY_DN776_c0_g1~~TRINITY_DN776_c0_g1_i1.p1  ORF type:complete len:127 (-),score=23.37 TRINITY_DN776_c0_g1_i1:51-431(-)